MNIHYHKIFIKHFKLRVKPNPKLDKRFQERLTLFTQDSSNPILDDHALTGKKSGYRSFSVTGNIRAVYEKVSDGILLHDIGTHNQVY